MVELLSSLGILVTQNWATGTFRTRTRRRAFLKGDGIESDFSSTSNAMLSPRKPNLDPLKSRKDQNH